jgi:hypothetical protein
VLLCWENGVFWELSFFLCTETLLTVQVWVL